jgi:hypothetical protein
MAIARDGRNDELRLELHRYVRDTVGSDEAPVQVTAHAKDAVGSGLTDDALRPVVPVPVHTNGNGSSLSRNGSSNGNGVAASAGSNGASQPAAHPDDGLLNKRIVIKVDQTVRLATDDEDATPAGHLQERGGAEE